MLLEAVLCEQLIYTWPKKEKKKHYYINDLLFTSSWREAENTNYRTKLLRFTFWMNNMFSTQFVWSNPSKRKKRESIEVYKQTCLSL
jgi:hypothetical protein